MADKLKANRNFVFAFDTRFTIQVGTDRNTPARLVFFDHLTGYERLTPDLLAPLLGTNHRLSADAKDVISAHLSAWLDVPVDVTDDEHGDPSITLSIPLEVHPGDDLAEAWSKAADLTTTIDRLLSPASAGEDYLFKRVTDHLRSTASTH